MTPEYFTTPVIETFLQVAMPQHLSAEWRPQIPPLLVQQVASWLPAERMDLAVYSPHEPNVSMTVMTMLLSGHGHDPEEVAAYLFAKADQIIQSAATEAATAGFTTETHAYIAEMKDNVKFRVLIYQGAERRILRRHVSFDAESP